jgi:hypothetical protein
MRVADPQARRSMRAHGVAPSTLSSRGAHKAKVESVVVHLDLWVTPASAHACHAAFAAFTPLPSTRS